MPASGESLNADCGVLIGGEGTGNTLFPSKARASRAVADGEDRHHSPGIIDMKPHKIRRDWHRSHLDPKRLKIGQLPVAMGKDVEAVDGVYKSLNHLRRVLGRVAADIIKNLLKLAGGVQCEIDAIGVGHRAP